MTQHTEARSDWWSLLTVTYAGEVNYCSFPTKSLAEEGRSLALTGMTIEQNHIADEEYHARIEREKAEWRAAHPARHPKDHYERSLVECRKKGALGYTLCSTSDYVNVGEDGLIYEYPGSGGQMWSVPIGHTLGFVRGQAVFRGPGDIRHCAIIPPEPTP